MLADTRIRGKSTKEHEYMLRRAKSQHGGSPVKLVGCITGKTGNKKISQHMQVTNNRKLIL